RCCDHPTAPPTPPPSLHDALPISASQERSWVPRATSKTTDPPRPPFPPSGPPRGLYGSECSEAEPAPPRPASTEIVHSSVNIPEDRKSTRLNSSHDQISYAVFCLK